MNKNEDIRNKTKKYRKMINKLTISQLLSMLYYQTLFQNKAKV